MAAVDPPNVQFEKFNPSFAAAGLGWLVDLYRQAFEDGRPALAATLAASPVDGTNFVEGVVDPRATLPIRFGHLEQGIAGISGDLSARCPYRLTVEVKNGTISSVDLRLFLLNTRAILTKSTFLPANVDNDGRFTELTTAVAPIGLAILADPSGDRTTRFGQLSAGVPAAALQEAPAGYQGYAPDTLMGRLDLTMKWSIGALSEATDKFGFVLGIPGGELPKGITLTTAALFSPELQTTFNGMLRPSGGFGVCLPRTADANLALIFNAPTKPGTTATPADTAKWELYRSAVTAFGLTQDFRGLLFGGFELHWLSDGNVGHDLDISLELGISALSFGEGHAANSSASWFVSFEAGIKSIDGDSYLALLTDLRVSASLADGEPTRFALTTTFKGDLGFPYQWLAERHARLALSFETWSDQAGAKHESKVISLELLGSSERVLARLTPDEPIPMDPAIFNSVAIALTLAPIVASSGAIDTQGAGIPPNANLRGYFADIQRESMAQLYTVAGLGWFFANAIKVKEIRVVGIRLQAQPASINGGSPGKTDTGLLFDYEVDYDVTIREASISTSRVITTRIDGTGIVVAGPNSLRWVQVPSGLRDLSLADPGLWDVGELGKILKLTEVTIRKTPRKELVLRLALSGNLGILTAGDFAFAMDLEDGNGLRLESFPSKVSVKIPSLLEGSGTFVIDKSGPQKDIGGSLDLTITPIGMRFYAGARVTKVVTNSGSTTTAVLATAEVEFATMIPLASSGLGLKGISALYAMHFVRLEPPAAPAVPPALAWLKKAKGDVVKSVELPASKTLWSPKYDSWAFGIGVQLGLQISDVLVSLNSMLVLELPGPKILVFSKLNILKIPQLNKNIADKLDTGFLGLLELDLEREEMTLAVLADVSFQKFFSFHAPIELFLGLSNLSKWHLYLGHFDNKIQAKLDILSVVNLAASGYFMAAGDRIAKAPVPGGPQDLPGTALAMGVDAHVHIGGGSLYLRVDLSNQLFISISKTLFAYGEARLSGELRLFIVSIGASGVFELSYLKKSGGGEQIYVRGEICGRVKIVFVKISGCVALRLGSPIVETEEFDPLIGSIAVLSGTRVALRGQGATGPFDSELFKLPQFDGGNVVGEVPLDAVLALKMTIPPFLAKNARGFAGTVTSLNQKETTFHLGSRLGQYRLDGVTLQRAVGGGFVDVDYANTPGRWWKQPQSQKGGQPVPHQLALLTRNPLGVASAITAPADLDAWVKAIVAGICDHAYEPQQCVFQWGSAQVGTGNDGLWTLPAILPNAKVVEAIGTSGATSESVRLLKRDNAGSPNDLFPGYPLYIGGCEVAYTATRIPFSYLKLMSLSAPEYRRITSAALFAGAISRRKPVELLIAHRLFGNDHALSFTFQDDGGREETIHLGSPDVERLRLLPGTADEFHDKQDYWREHAKAFVDAQDQSQFAGMEFERVRLFFDRLQLAGTLTSFKVHLDSEIGTDRSLTVLIGALKFVPLAEEARYQHDFDQKEKIKSELIDYLTQPQVPLLEPDSEYRLDVNWGTSGDGRPDKYSQFRFRTTNEPPRDITPYLITTFPVNGEKFHYPKDTPGIVLGSNDLLRILRKFTGARLRVTITEDGGNPVLDPTGTREWHKGVSLEPAQLLDAITHPVPGVEVKSVAALPTALEQALLEFTQNGGDLSCLGEIELPEAALWIGFNTSLRPISGYVVKIDVVDAAPVPQAWTYAKSSAKGDEAMLLFSFRTGLHSDLEEHVTRLGEAIIGHRVASILPVFDALSPASSDGVRTTADKNFEDSVATSLGERPSHDGDVSVTVVWTGKDQILVPSGVLLRSNEPLVRTTKTGALAKAQGQDYIAELVDVALQAIDQAGSTGIEDVVVSNSGFAMFAKLDNGAGAGISLGFAGCQVDRIPRPITKAQLNIAAGHLTPRKNTRA
ncbi:hypothetical protein NKY68_00185 [Sinorhizobium meliloti]|uniref:hypothetical protein n=1 Tax=Rhizobium meliloti TaxID=382 RepID=UPI003D64BBCA